MNGVELDLTPEIVDHDLDEEPMYEFKASPKLGISNSSSAMRSRLSILDRDEGARMVYERVHGSHAILMGTREHSSRRTELEPMDVDDLEDDMDIVVYDEDELFRGIEPSHQNNTLLGRLFSRSLSSLEPMEWPEEDVDPTESSHRLRLLYALAHKNDASAQIKVGLIYARGLEGCRENTEKALEWLHRAADPAEINDDEAQWILAALYATGNNGVINRDIKQALEWYQCSAAQGNHTALFRLGLLNYSGFGEESPNIERSFNYFKSAAKKGNTDAMNNVGIMYIYGMGIKKNTKKGFKWLRKSGTTLATQNIIILYKNNIVDAPPVAVTEIIEQARLHEYIDEETSKECLMNGHLFLSLGPDVPPLVIEGTAM